MFEGRYRRFSRVEAKLSVGADVTAGSVGDTNWSVDGEFSFWQALAPGAATETEAVDASADETLLFVKWLKMCVIRTQSGDTWTVDWPERSYFGSGTGSELLLQMDDYHLYVRNDGTWRLRLGECRLYVGGVLEQTFGADDFDSSGLASPGEVPFPLTMPMAFGSANATNSVGVADAAGAGWAYSTTASVTGEIEFGWRYIEGGDVFELPVLWPNPVLPSGNSAAIATVEGSTTWDSILTVSASETLSDEWCSPGPATVLPNPYNERTATNGRVWPVPVLDGRIVRMATPHEQLAFRGGFPRVDTLGYRSHYESESFFPDISPDPQIDNPEWTEVLPEYSSFLGVLGDIGAVIEDQLTGALFSPVVLSGSDTEGGEVGLDEPWGGTLPAACSSPDWRTGRLARIDSATFMWPGRVQTRNGEVDIAVNNQILSWVSHQSPMARLIHTWFCPFWSWANWFPVNTIDTNADTVPDQQSVWQVFGADIEAEYWLESRQQWMHHSSLESDIDRRNLMLSEVLNRRNGTLNGYTVDEYFGQPGGWLGISNFEAQVPNVPASLTMDSSSSGLVSGLVNCSVAAGASIVATPAAAGDIEVAIDAASFTVKPFLFGALSKEFKFNWSTTNVSALNVYAEGWDGSRVLVYESADKDTWKEWPLDGLSDKFAGSWEQDFGRGFVTDDGADIDAAGISPATMGDVLRSHVFGLLPGRTCRRFVFVITPAAVSAVTINWPSFRQTDSKFIPEIAQQGAFIVPNGPGVRWGNGAWWDRGLNAFSNPPILQGPETMPTILDGLCARRVLFEGIAGDDGLDTEIAGLYDSGIEYTNVRKHMAVDPIDQGQSTYSFWVDGETAPVLCLVSSMREYPPMAAYPVRDRDADWQTNDNPVQNVWVNCPRRKYYTSWRGALPLFDVLAQVNAPDDAKEVEGWSILSHENPVTNDEDPFEFLGPAGTTFAELRPWHGSFGVLNIDSNAQGCLSCDAHSDGRMFRAYLENGEVVIDHRAVVGGWTKYYTGVMADWVAIRIDKRTASPVLSVVTVESNAVKLYESGNSGESLGMATTIHSTGTPRYPAVDMETDGNSYIYWLNNSSAPYIVQGLIRDRDGNTLMAATTVLSGVDDAPIAVRRVFGPGGTATIYLQVVIGGAVVEYSSPDGLNFT